MKKKTLIKSAFGLALSLCVYSCASDNAEPNSPAVAESDFVAEIPETKTLNISESQKAAVSSSTDFGLNLFSAVAENYSSCSDEKNGNFSVSPLSATLNLALTSNLMDSDSRQAIAKALGYADCTEMNETSRQLLAYFNTPGNTGLDVNLVNSLWWKTQLKDYLNMEIVELIGKYFYAPCFETNFTDNSSIDNINRWVAENTRGKITRLLQYYSDEIKQNISQISVNALYVNGRWNVPFKKSETSKSSFKGASGDSKVDMMHGNYVGCYGKTDKYEFAIIDFEGYAQMTIILPTEGNSAESLSRNLGSEWTKGNLNKSELYNIDIKLPKFEISSSLRLNAALSSLGIEFGSRSRNELFKGFDDLDIAGNETIQKTSLIINEEGAEMAAATSTVIYTGMAPTSDKNVEMVVDRPFIYLISDSKTGCVLMAGRVCNI